jgi:hypothetical protein
MSFSYLFSAVTFDKPPSNSGPQVLSVPQVLPRPVPLEGEDVKIWSIAGDLLAQHGNKAAQEALGRANEMLDRGDRGQQVMWLRVRMAILLRSGKAAGDAVE